MPMKWTAKAIKLDRNPEGSRFFESDEVRFESSYTRFCTNVGNKLSSRRAQATVA
jgi:hypothetical protein